MSIDHDQRFRDTDTNKTAGAAGTCANSPNSGSESSTTDRVGDDDTAGTARLSGM